MRKKSEEVVPVAVMDIVGRMAEATTVRNPTTRIAHLASESFRRVI